MKTVGRLDGPTATRREALIAGVGLVAGLVLPTALDGEPAVRPSGRPAASLKQSACRWPYRSIPLTSFCQAAKGMGLTGIDLLTSDEWPVRPMPLAEIGRAHV